MEVGNSAHVNHRVLNLFLREPVPFATRREINWKTVKVVCAVTVILIIGGLLAYPTSESQQSFYHEKIESGLMQVKAVEVNPSAAALNQFEQARAGVGGVPKNFDYLYGVPKGGVSEKGNNRDRSQSMILTRGGLDSKTQLPPGSRIRVRIVERVIVADQSMPVIGIVSSDFIHGDGLAIPKDAKLFGEVAFESAAERAQISWRAIQMPDGRERPFSALSVDRDGQVGIEGQIHSNAVKNTVGQTVTRFIGAYAEGSMQRGAYGASQGGHDNGLKRALADTAKDRADAWAEDLKKEKKWIELSAGTEFFAVLREPFTFRDPGGYFR